ncbi:MAG TPA: hypothetical protein VFW94_23090 [Candidatus Acidoferrales bacterium]|nr:hypothetical protein [Candidatus Acidoferrales bacterium]
MNPLSRSVAVIGIAACWCVSASAAPTCIPSRAEMGGLRQTTQVESVSGRIATVSGNTFTIELVSPEKNGTSVLTITIDQDTVVHGKIAVGKKADVTFRREDHTNIAVTVRTLE